MNTSAKFFCAALGVIALQVGLTGCVAGGGYVESDGGVYYGGGPDPWFYDGGWVDGHRWYRGHPHDSHVFIHPPADRFHHGPGPSAPHPAPHAPAPRPGNPGHSGGDHRH